MVNCQKKTYGQSCSRHYSNRIYVFFLIFIIISFPPISFQWWCNSNLHLACFNMLSAMTCCSLIMMPSTRVSLLEFSFPCSAKAVGQIVV